MYPQEAEAFGKVKLRTDIIRKQFVEEVEGKPEKFGMGGQDGKLAIVGHSIFFKILTTVPEFWDKVYSDPNHELYHALPSNDYSATLSNCEIYPFKY